MDSDGDAYVVFDDIPDPQLVFRENFRFLDEAEALLVRGKIDKTDGMYMFSAQEVGAGGYGSQVRSKARD